MVMESHVARGRHERRMFVTHDHGGWIVYEEKDARVTAVTPVADWRVVEQMFRRFEHRALREEAGAPELPMQ